MIFVILFFVSLLVIAGVLLAINKRTHGIRPTKSEAWFNPDIGIILEHLSEALENLMRDGMRELVLILLHWYRKFGARIRIKSYVKEKLREYLYEHSRDEAKTSSQFLRHVRHGKKPGETSQSE